MNYTAYVGTELGSNTQDFVIASVNMMPGSYAMKAATPTESNTWLNGEYLTRIFLSVISVECKVTV